MPERTRPNLASAAASIYPNLPSGTPNVVRQRQQGTVADAMYPSLAPKPKPPAPRPRLSREEGRDWSNINPSWARLVGLVPKGRR